MRLLKQDLIRLGVTAWLKLIYTPKSLRSAEGEGSITAEQAEEFRRILTFQLENNENFSPSYCFSFLEIDYNPSSMLAAAAEEAGISSRLFRGKIKISVNFDDSTISQKIGRLGDYVSILNEDKVFPVPYKLDIPQAMKAIDDSFGKTALILDEVERQLIMSQLQEKLESIEQEKELLVDYAMLAAPDENAYFPSELADIAQKEALNSLTKSATKAIKAQIDQLDKEIKNPSFVLSFFSSAANADKALKTKKMDFLQLFYNHINNDGMSVADSFNAARRQWKEKGKDYAEVIQGTFSQRTLNLLKKYVGDEASKLEDIECNASLIS